MEKGYAEKMKDVMQRVFEMADNLDAKGIGKQIPFVNKSDGMRGAIKTDILLFLLRVTDPDKLICPACRRYINDCLGYDFGELTIEMARKKAVESNLPKICTLLPYFILLDKQIGGCAISTVYVQTLCFIALGYIAEQEHTSLEEMVRYCRYATTCLQMIEKTLNEKVDFDPLGFIDSDKKDIITTAVEVDKLLHKADDDPVVKELEEALCSIVAGRENPQNLDEDSRIELSEPVLIKDPGDGSDLPDENETPVNNG